MRPVVVLGMHRSGTSAVAGVLVHLGLNGPRPWDRYDAPDNPEHHESWTLTRANELVLARAGGTWWAPPPEGAIKRVSPALARQVQRALPEGPAVVKDPRLCLTLPAWGSVFDGDIALVMVVRNPVKVASSLEQRDGFPHADGLALWEWYVVMALRNARGRDTYLLHYEDLVTNTTTAVSCLAEALCGSTAEDSVAEQQAAASVLAEGGQVPATVRGDVAPLYELLRDHSGWIGRSVLDGMEVSQTARQRIAERRPSTLRAQVRAGRLRWRLRGDAATERRARQSRVR